MNTLHFKYAVEVEKTGSITQAAENLFMGQPNLSKAIIELEETLGFMIFERTSKGVIPTAKGTQFLLYAKNILTQIDKMESLADEGGAQSLSVGFSRSSYIAGAIAKFTSEFDFSAKVRLNVRETSSVAVINSVAAGSFNLGVIRYPLTYEKYFLDYLDDKELDMIPLWEFSAMAVFSGLSRPVGKKPEPADLSSMIPIVYGDEAVPYLSSGESRKELKSVGAEQKILVYDRATAAELLVALPRCYMLAEPISRAELEKHGLVQQRCAAPERFKDALIFSKGYRFSDSDRKFFGVLTQTKNEMELDLR